MFSILLQNFADSPRDRNMRIPIILIVTFLPLSMAAQEFRHGPKLGIGASTQSYGQFLAWNGQPKLGPLVGWSFELPVTTQISLLIEPMYIAKGIRSVNSYYKTRTSITYNYLEIPVLLKISTNPDPQGLFLTGGLLYGYFLGGREKDFEYGNLINNYTFPGTSSTNRSQLSAALGIGHEQGSWMWEVRAESSLNTFDPVVSSHNIVYSFQVAWRFPTPTEKEKQRSAAGS